MKKISGLSLHCCYKSYPWKTQTAVISDLKMICHCCKFRSLSFNLATKLNLSTSLINWWLNSGLLSSKEECLLSLLKGVDCHLVLLVVHTSSSYLADLRRCIMHDWDWSSVVTLSLGLPQWIQSSNQPPHETMPEIYLYYGCLSPSASSLP